MVTNLHGGRKTFIHSLKIFLMFIYFWERETEHEWGRGIERSRHRIWSRFQALSCRHRARHGARTHELGYHDLSWSWTLNQTEPHRCPEGLHTLNLAAIKEGSESNFCFILRYFASFFKLFISLNFLKIFLFIFCVGRLAFSYLRFVFLVITVNLTFHVLEMSILVTATLGVVNGSVRLTRHNYGFKRWQKFDNLVFSRVVLLSLNIYFHWTSNL